MPGDPCDQTSSMPSVDVKHATEKVVSNRIFWRKSSDVSVVSDPHEMINPISLTYRISHKKKIFRFRTVISNMMLVPFG